VADQPGAVELGYWEHVHSPGAAMAPRARVLRPKLWPFPTWPGLRSTPTRPTPSALPSRVRLGYRGLTGWTKLGRLRLPHTPGERRSGSWNARARRAGLTAAAARCPAPGASPRTQLSPDGADTRVRQATTAHRTQQPVTTAHDPAGHAPARKWHVLLHPAMLTSHQTSIDKMAGTSERGLVESDDHRSSRAYPVAEMPLAWQAQFTCGVLRVCI
jgi:hypothetical protein